MEEQQSQDVSLEQVFEELEQVIQRLENDTSLEESFSLYHRGMDLLKACSDKIDRVEKKIQMLDERGEAHEF